MNPPGVQRGLLATLGLVLGLLAGCTSLAENIPLSPVPSTNPTIPPAATAVAGTWGGKHVSLTIDAGGATLEFDCAHGSLSAPLSLDANGHFDIAGTYVAEGGVMSQEPPPDRPARYSGTIAGQT